MCDGEQQRGVHGAEVVLQSVTLVYFIRLKKQNQYLLRDHSPTFCIYSNKKRATDCISCFSCQFPAHLCDGVCERADHHAPHPPQLLLALQGPGTASNGTEHRLGKRQRGGVARQAAAHQSLKALKESGDGRTSGKDLDFYHIAKLQT